MDATFDHQDPFSVKESRGLISQKEQPLCALCKGVKMLCGKERCPMRS
jgi:hypothetical protein